VLIKGMVWGMTCDRVVCKKVKGDAVFKQLDNAKPLLPCPLS
jgi:hypothetical protein